MAEIIYNGQSTKDFNLRIINDVTHVLSSNDVETMPIAGRDGVLLIDNQRLKPVERSFPMKIFDNVYPKTVEIAEWFGVKGWHDLELSWDNEFIYRATVINTISIQEVLKQLGRVQVVFLVHPVKHLKTSLQPIYISKGQTIINTGNVLAKPIIEMSGNGNTVITINGRRTPLEDVQGSIVLDMQRQMVFSGNLSAWDKLLREENAHKPYLDIGNNVITWTGDFTMQMTTYEGVRI